MCGNMKSELAMQMYVDELQQVRRTVCSTISRYHWVELSSKDKSCSSRRYQGRIELPKAARGHATSNSANIDSIVLNVTKNRDPRAVRPPMP